MLFEVWTTLGFQVRVTHSYWGLITTVKHPIMAGRDAEVRETLERPDEIRQSRRDPTVYLFYQARGKRWVCAVVKRVNTDGFLITAYPTDAIKEGARVWPR